MMGNTQRRLSSFSMAFLLLLLLSIGLPHATPEGIAYSQSDAPAPDIQVTPAAIEVTLREGQSMTVPLTIANAGAGELAFSISEQSIAAAVQSRQRPSSWFAETLRQDDVPSTSRRGEPFDGAQDRPVEPSRHSSPHNKVEPALLSALDTAPDGQATFIVYLKEQADLSPAYNIRDWQARGEFVYRTLRETARRSQKGLLAELWQQKSAGAITDYRSFFIVNAIAVAGGRSAVEALATHPDVAYLISDFRFQISDLGFDGQSTPQFTIHNPQFTIHNSVEWNIAKIRAERVWTDFGVTGEGVVVASIDTGVDYTHPALVNQYRGTATGSHDYNWYDPTGTYPSAPGDNNDHGTYVTGLMVGDDGAGNQIGVAPGAQWIAAKGCVGQWCERVHLLQSAQWLLAPCPIGVDPGGPACDPAKRPQVINNSWGGDSGDQWFRSLVEAWRAAGIVPVLAAGNSGAGGGAIGSACNYPALCVGATDRADVICSSSSQEPTVVAPGCGDIRSAVPGGSYAIWNGVGSPHVAGVAALVLAANPSLSVEELETLLTSTAVDLGPPGPDHTYGYGRIDAYAAVAQAADPIPWLSVDPTSGNIAPNSQTVVDVTLDTSGLSAGTRTASLVVTSNDPDDPALTVPVILIVPPGQPEIAHVRVAGVRDVSAAISWITFLPTAGQIYYGTDPANLTNVAYDDRGAGIQSKVHRVTLMSLSPDTTYYFYVVSDEAWDDNNGDYYRFTTGAPLSVPPIENIYGQVFWNDGTPAADVLVYLRIVDRDGSGSPARSGLLSGLTQSDGYWSDPATGGPINLATVRTENGQGYFKWEPSDVLRVEVQAGNGCRTAIQTGLDTPIQPITLSCQEVMEFDIYPGWQIIVFPALPVPDYDAQGLLEDIAAQGGCPMAIYNWASDLGNWASYLRGLPFGNFLLQPGWPYFLSASCPSLLHLPPKFITNPRECLTLTTGWNLLALPSTTEAMTSEVACEQVVAQGGSVSEIVRWNADTGDWAGHVCGLPFGDFEMTPGEGYFIKSEADSVWCPAPSDE